MQTGNRTCSNNVNVYEDDTIRLPFNETNTKIWFNEIDNAGFE